MNTIAKFANGIADNLLTGVYATWEREKPIVVAPAMNSRMWDSGANKRNIKLLVDDGVYVFDPKIKGMADVWSSAESMTSMEVILKTIDDLMV